MDEIINDEIIDEPNSDIVDEPVEDATNHYIDTLEEPIKTFVINLKTLLNVRDFGITDSDEDTFVLEYEIKRAIQEINKCRRFEPTEERPYDPKYESLILPLSISAFAKIGAEGQSSHSENGIVRTYTSGGDYPIDVLNGIIPLVK